MFGDANAQIAPFGGLAKRSFHLDGRGKERMNVQVVIPRVVVDCFHVDAQSSSLVREDRIDPFRVDL